MSSHKVEHSAKVSDRRPPVQQVLPPTTPSVIPDSQSHLIQLQKSIGNRALIQLMKSQRQRTAFVQKTSSLNHNGEPIQRFKGEDKHNTGRREKARNQTNEDMKLDHTISQESLENFTDHLDLIKLATESKKTFYFSTKEAYGDLIDTIASLPEFNGKTDNLKNPFLNFHNNLVPGFQDTTGDRGSRFDPQIEMKGNQAIETETSERLREIDTHVRKLGRLCALLPKNQDWNDMNNYNEKLDDHLAKTLNEIAKHLSFVGNQSEPAFNQNIWYKYTTYPNNEKEQQQIKVKNVKRVPSEWLDNKPEYLSKSKDKYPTLSETSFTWDYMVTNYKVLERSTELSDNADKAMGKGRITGSADTYENDEKITFNVTIPQSCWQHIYDRHTIAGFANDIQSINTFWKDDPITKITQDLLQPEIELLVDRLVNLSNLNEDDYYDLNGTANKLFFQGDMDVTFHEVEVKSENNAEDETDDFKNNRHKKSKTKNIKNKKVKNEITKKIINKIINISLKSIAPEHPDLAYAIEPSILQQK
ncbi:putative C2H2-type domain-containing protein [Brevibacillus sp. IT-7CA2]|uniref:hypothetical protein n=1 Tax=Brevibacillus sp. IT-7CA2 TaxID=3026436 RepID=UPI0039E12AB6